MKWIFVLLLWTFPQFSYAAEAANQSCDQIDELVTTTPSPPITSENWHLHAKVMSSISPSKYDVVIVGDSIAETWPSAIWAPKRVLNLGMGADRTQQVLWRLASPELNTIDVRTVIVALGVNNLGARDKVCALTVGLKTVFGRIAELWPKAHILFFGVHAIGEGLLFRNAERKQINANIGDLKNVTSIDLEDELTCSRREPCPNYQPDHLHFTDAGFWILSRAAKQAIINDPD
jgi:lysophospholipase L1-like esterase